MTFFLITRKKTIKGNVIPSPATADRVGESSGEIHTRERLGGLLKFYHREAA